MDEVGDTCYFIEAEWVYDEDARVSYSFYRRVRYSDEEVAQHAQHGLPYGEYANLHAGDARSELCTLNQAREFAFAWLAENAGMQKGDSFTFQFGIASHLAEIRNKTEVDG
jgi:hypothetical protein